MNTNQLTEKTLAKYFDHSLLKAFSTDDDLIQLCKEAKEIGAAMVAINSYPVKLCKEYLKDTDVHVGAAISFPLGQTTIEVKAFETKVAIQEGADEIDYVVNIGKVKLHEYDYIEEEMKVIVDICRKANVISKVIFENCYLTKEEIKQLALIAKKVKPDFIKTSTGFGTGGATLEDVKLMVETVEGEVKVKAAGGIRDWATCKALIEAGALLKNAPILILDDSLSAVDTDTEDQILDNLKQKRQDKTTIMIAHRISTVKNADKILVLENGRKAEYGTFDELMALDGIFKEMYDKQQLEKQLSAS